jgi:hypothetical protein
MDLVLIDQKTDLVYYGNQRELEYDWIVNPGADPRCIQFKVEERVIPKLDAQGNLLVDRNHGLQLNKPFIYQERGGSRAEIAGAYVILDNGKIGFQLGQYDTSRILVVDPVLSYSTYFGGGGSYDSVRAIAVDSLGNSYLTGEALSADFPTANPFQGNYSGNGDIFVTKLNASGNGILYSTYIGGGNDEVGTGIAVDSSGDAHVTGYTFSTDLPTTNPFQTNKGWGYDAFVTKLSASGSALIYSTYLGGGSLDYGNKIAVDFPGNAYVTGYTYSTDFPTANPFQPANGGASDAFITKINASGSALIYSTYLGGSSNDEGYGIGIDSSGAAYVTGRTSSTDSSGNVYVSGYTDSTNFPTVNPFRGSLSGSSDIFITKIAFQGCTIGDIDGDGKADIAVSRPSSGVRYFLPSGSPGTYKAIQWGLENDIPVAGDYDGDGKMDIAVYRPSTGAWYILSSNAPGTYLGLQWGTASDIPVSLDYDGDGKMDIAVYRPSTGLWYILPSNAPGTYIGLQWGDINDVPVPRDYDGDGKIDIAVWRPGTGIWYVLPSGSPGAYKAVQWGINTDIPVPGDYDGDGRTDIAVWRPATGVWYVLASGAPGTYTSSQWGLSSDIPSPADYDGDGKIDIAVWRPGNGTLLALPSGFPGTYTSTQWGVNSDKPISTLTRIPGQ